MCGWGCLRSCLEHGEFGSLLRLQGSVLPKALLFAVPSGGIAVGLHYFFEYLGYGFLHPPYGKEIWASFNFVLGVLIVFRTNQAYSRYWEGATLLLQVQGEWFNATSSLFAFCSPEESKKEGVLRFQHQTVRLMSMLYCAALQQVALISDDRMKIISCDGLDEEALSFLVSSKDRCDVLLQWMRRLVVLNMSNGVIPAPPPILTRVFQELSRGIVSAKDVQKISELPFPFPYSQMILVLLIMQSFMTPVLASLTVEEPAWAFVVTFSAILVLWSMNYIAAEIEQPFGEDHNDLPIANMLRDMNSRLSGLLLPQAHVPPNFDLAAADGADRYVSCLDVGYTSNRSFVEGFGKDRSRSFNQHQRERSFRSQSTSKSFFSETSNATTGTVKSNKGYGGRIGVGVDLSAQQPLAMTRISEVSSQASPTAAASQQEQDLEAALASTYVDWQRGITEEQSTMSSENGPLLCSEDRSTEFTEGPFSGVEESVSPKAEKVLLGSSSFECGNRAVVRKTLLEVPPKVKAWHQRRPSSSRSLDTAEENDEEEEEDWLEEYEHEGIGEAPHRSEPWRIASSDSLRSTGSERLGCRPESPTDCPMSPMFGRSDESPVGFAYAEGYQEVDESITSDAMSCHAEGRSVKSLSEMPASPSAAAQATSWNWGIDDDPEVNEDEERAEVPETARGVTFSARAAELVEYTPSSSPVRAAPQVPRSCGLGARRPGKDSQHAGRPAVTQATTMGRPFDDTERPVVRM